MESLWKIPEPVAETPLSVLKEQAKILSDETKGLLQGDVRSGLVGQGMMTSSLYIVVPSLSNYRFKVLDVVQNAALFPGYVVGDFNLDNNEFDDLEKFRAKLKIILSSAEIEKIVGGLLAQATSASAA